MRGLDQEALDKDRQTYVLSHPTDLDADRITAWVRSVSGTKKSIWHGFRGKPTIAFETWSTGEGIKHRIKIPWQNAADYIIPQLRLHGVTVTPDESRPKLAWTHVVEIGLQHSARTLAIYNAAQASASLLASVAAVKEHEIVMVQIVATPTSRQKLPAHEHARSLEPGIRMLTEGATANRDEVNERRDKLGEPNMLAILRIGVVANTDQRAKHLARRVQQALTALQGHATRFIGSGITTHNGRMSRINEAASPAMRFPMQLSASELATLIAWPIDSPGVAGLPPMSARHVHASQLVPTEGIVLGHSNVPGAERPIAVSFEDARKHTHVLGSIGSGKTALMGNYFRQVVAKGYGAVLIERKGDLFSAAMDYIPADRVNDVIVLDVTDEIHPVAFNVLDQGDPLTVIDEITALIDYLSRGTGSSVWLKSVSYHGLRTLVTQPGTTLVDLPALLVPNADEVIWRDNLIRGLKDKELRNFWQRMDNLSPAQYDNMTRPVLDRYWQLVNRPAMRNIIGQSHSSFQLADVLNQKKILLINLSRLPKETAELFGSMMFNLLWDTVQREQPKSPLFLFLDEFQSYVNLPFDPEDMLVKARSLGLPMVLAHQHLNQLPSSLLEAIQSNTKTKVVFQTGAKDARAMSNELPGVTVDDLQHLGEFETAVRVGINGGSSPSLTMKTLPPAKGYGRANQVKASSRQQYGRHVSTVEQDILTRRHTPDKPAGGSILGEQDGWGSDTE